MAWEVVVVDGAPASRRHLVLALSAAGYRVVGLPHGEAARAELAGSQPRLIVSELLVEGMDGFDLLGWARSRWGAAVELLAVTGVGWGHVDLGSLVRERFGAGFLRKPFLRSEAVRAAAAAIGPAPGDTSPLPAEWRIGVAEAERAQRFALEYERRLVRLGSNRARRSPRARVACTVQINQQGVWVERPVVNLSAGGLFIESDTPAEPDQILELALEIPGLGRSVRAEGRVANRVSAERVASGQRPGFGVQFLNLAEADRRALQALVQDLRGEGEGDDPAGPPAPVLLVGLPAEQLLGRPGFLHRRDFEVLSAPVIEDAEEMARLQPPALCLVHERTIRPDPARHLARLGRLVSSPSCILVLGPTSLSPLLGAGLCGALLRPDTPTVALHDEIRQRLGIAERAAMRVPHQVPVEVGAGDELLEGEIIDVSVGGLLVRAPRPLAVGTALALAFALPDGARLRLRGEVVRQERERGEPSGRCGVAFRDLDPTTLESLRRFVQSHVPFRDYFVWLKQAYYE